MTELRPDSFVPVYYPVMAKVLTATCSRFSDNRDGSTQDGWSTANTRPTRFRLFTHLIRFALIKPLDILLTGLRLFHLAHLQSPSYFSIHLNYVKIQHPTKRSEPVSQLALYTRRDTTPALIAISGLYMGECGWIQI